MDEQRWMKNYYEIFKAIDYCVNNLQIMPALILIYSSMDSISWLFCNEKGPSNRKRFVKWVTEWMLADGQLPCTGEELYKARCAILHTLTPDSHTNNKEPNRTISYAWGKAKVEDLTKAIKLLNYQDIVGIQLEELSRVFRVAFAACIDETMKNPQKQHLFIEKANKHYANTSISDMTDLISTAN
jgi:hypothetical protein